MALEVGSEKRTPDIGGNDIKTVIDSASKRIQLIGFVDADGDFVGADALEIVSVGTVDEVTNVTSVDTVDAITVILSVTDVVNVQSVDAVDLVTEVTNVTSVDTVDVVTELTSITNEVDINVAKATFDHGSKSGITTAAVQITTDSIDAKQGVVIKAARGNAGVVYVGNSDVTADTVDATDGFELSGGESVIIPVNNANKVYVRASESGQRVYWVLA